VDKPVVAIVVRKVSLLGKKAGTQKRVIVL
jgi:hypothetical protein